MDNELLDELLYLAGEVRSQVAQWNRARRPENVQALTARFPAQQLRDELAKFAAYAPQRDWNCSGSLRSWMGERHRCRWTIRKRTSGISGSSGPLAQWEADVIPRPPSQCASLRSGPRSNAATGAATVTTHANAFADVDFGGAGGRCPGGDAMTSRIPRRRINPASWTRSTSSWRRLSQLSARARTSGPRPRHRGHERQDRVTVAHTEWTSNQ